MAPKTDLKSENDVKIGVYVCHCGGNISDHLDVEAVAQNAERLNRVTKARTNTFMCSDPGQELIMEDIRSGLVNRVVVASCAPSLHETTFRGAIARSGLNPFLYEHANIREQVSWVHHGDSATQKASALVAAAAAKAGQLDSLESFKVEAQKHATVIGGGVAGLKACLDLARKGLDVTLVEKSPFLGGFTAQLTRLAPTGESAGDLVSHLAGQVLEHPRIKVLTCATVTETAGYIGHFEITVRETPPRSEDRQRLTRFEEAGAPMGQFVPLAGVLPHDPPISENTQIFPSGSVVVATGFSPYRPFKGEYGFGEYPEVVTLPEFIRHLESDQVKGGALIMNGKAIRTLAMIHCVGSREIPGIHEPGEDRPVNEHCSRVCCTSTLFWAARVRELYPDTSVLDFYRDIRTYGRGHEEVYAKASDLGVIFFRFEPDAPPRIEPNGPDRGLTIRVRDTLTFGQDIEASVDLVVLSVGMTPGSAAGLAEIMKLPVGADRFLLEVHPKLRPVEVANAGIFLAGTCQAPMDAGESVEAAQAAAAKASVLLSKGHVELDPYVARVDPELCQVCGDCVRVCPSAGAIAIQETPPEKQTVVNPALCNGCGICVAACPHHAVDIAGWTLSQYEAMVDAIVASA